MSMQCRIVLDHMQKQGPIIAKMAADLYGIQRLSARIKDLKEIGVGIKSQFVTGINRYGCKVHYKEYWLA